MTRLLPPLYVCHYTPNHERLAYLAPFLAIWEGGSCVVVKCDADESDVFSAHLGNVNNVCSWEARKNLTLRQIPVQLAHQDAIRSRKGITDHDCYLNAYLKCQSSSAQDWRLFKHLIPRTIGKSVLSLNLKHRYAYSLAAVQNQSWILVAEDDVLFEDSSCDYISEVYCRLKEAYSDLEIPVFVDIAGGCGLRARNMPQDNHFPALVMPSGTCIRRLVPTTRTTCAYLVNLAFVTRFLQVMPSPRTAIDTEITGFMLDSLAGPDPVHCYWLEPIAFVHGSEVGRYASSVVH